MMIRDRAVLLIKSFPLTEEEAATLDREGCRIVKMRKGSEDQIEQGGKVYSRHLDLLEPYGDRAVELTEGVTPPAGPEAPSSYTLEEYGRGYFRLLDKNGNTVKSGLRRKAMKAYCEELHGRVVGSFFDTGDLNGDRAG